MLQEGDDYPAPGFAVAKAVAADPSARGILVCGSGVGVAIAANRVPHARAVVAHDEEEAALARRHNDANILALSGRSQAAADALPIIRRFLGTAPDPDERHHRRIRQLDA
jgi:ribose 5-phosphate isomerase B